MHGGNGNASLAPLIVYFSNLQPLTVLCFSLQKSLTLSLSSFLLFLFRKLAPRDPWDPSVAGPLLAVAAPQSYNL